MPSRKFRITATSLVLILASFIIFTNFSLSHSPPLEELKRISTPATGDWIVTGAEIRQNEVIILNGNLTIQSGGELTLHNVTLYLNSSYDGEFHIEVENGGILAIRANSEVAAYNSSQAWFLKANRNSSLLLKDSSFSHAGYSYGTDGELRGLWVSSDNAQIINCTIRNNYDGVFVYNAENVTIANNSITTCKLNGIYLYQANNSAMSYNTITQCSRGISLKNSDDNRVQNNTIENSSDRGINIRESYRIKASDNAITNSRSNGISLFLCNYSDVSGNRILRSSEDGIALWDSHYNTMRDNTVHHTADAGINLHWSSHCSLENNIVNISSSNGFHMENSDHSIIRNNTISHSSGHGLFMEWETSESIVNRNTISNSSRHGIYLHVTTGGCFLWENSLSSSGFSHAWDANGTNQWDNGSHGNWWDNYTGIDSNYDGIGDSPFSIPGDAGAEDRFPLMEPLVKPDVYSPRINDLLPITYAKGETGYSITWLSYYAHPANYTIYRNGTVIEIKIWNGSAITISIDGLAVGVYNFTLVVFDDAGNYAKHSVIVTVATPRTSATSASIPGFTSSILLIAAVALLGLRMLYRSQQRQNRKDL